MVTFALSGSAVRRGGADVLVLPFWSAGGGPAPDLASDLSVAAASALVGFDVAASVRRVPSFTGAVGEHVVVGGSAVGAPLVVALGVGAAPGSVDQVRAAAMHAGRSLRGYRRLVTTAAAVGPDRAASVRAFVEGFLLGSYDPPFTGSRTVDPAAAPVAAVQLLISPADARSAAVRRAVERGIVTGETASWVRTLVETPGGSLTPDDLADAIRTRARAAGVTCTIWSDRQLHARGFGGLLGVGQGSTHPPRLVELVGGRERLARGERPLALTGKGITFDSGGINIKKDPAEIAWMKSDMAAAAAVAGAVIAAAALGLGAPVRALLPLAENMPGGRAIRPGDVLTHPGGRTSEVTDTDCEGRLVLADTIAYLAGQQPAGIIDVGTLTDGGGVGHALWGAWGTDPALVRSLVAAGATAGEPGWELPLVPSYVELMRSPVADIANCSKVAPDSAILAATYLRTFAGDVPWVHVDNGSSAYLGRDADGWPEGATGSPMRALLQLLEER
jgi:leucyl aminopeptidase